MFGAAVALNRTKIGLLIRAGVQDREMVESLGYRIRRLFVGVFVGSALAGLGGVMWGLYQQNVVAADRRAGQRADLHRHHHRRPGLDGRALIGALLVGLMANYTGFLAPKVALFFQHRADGGGAAVAPAGPSTRSRTDDEASCSTDFSPTTRLAAAGWRDPAGWCWALFALPVSGAKALGVAAKMLVFIVLVASFDLLLGYTGIVSFAHTMFFGIGAYGVAIASTRMGPLAGGWRWAWALALLLSLLLSLVMGLFSLRVKAIFFAMITLAVAAAFQTLASQLSDFTGGEDGLTFKGTRGCCSPAPSSRSRRRCSAPRSTGAAHLLPAVLHRGAVLVLALLRIVNSPFGACCRRSARTTSAPRPSATAWWSTAPSSNVLSALFATLAGCLLALWLRYQGPDTSLSFEIMLDILLDRRDRRHGHDHGAVIGRRCSVIAQNYLQDLLRLGASAADWGVPVLAALVSPDRWLLWLGLLFVLSVYHFPTGVVGRLRA